MQPGFVRVIAGKWRGRRLTVPDVTDLRPTPDRVRETLFNWLAMKIVNARCLDLFAGSGALGFEALSRGASYVEMVDQSAQVVNLLQDELQTFKADNACVYQATVPRGLRPATQPFDIIFIDPPYDANILFSCCEFLEIQGYLANSAYVYLEAKQRIKDNDLPSTWQLLKAKQAGQVYYHLAQKNEMQLGNRHEAKTRKTTITNW